MRFSMKELDSRKFNIGANMLAAVVGLLVIGIAVKNHLTQAVSLKPPAKQNVSRAVVGSLARSIADFNYQQAPRTLVLFLDAQGEDSFENVRQFKAWTATQASHPELFRIVALFANDQRVVADSLKSWDWTIEHRANVTPADYQVEIVPSIWIVNQNSRIEKSWSGALSSAEGVDIMKALGVPVHHEYPPPYAAKASLPTYDESKPIQTVTLPDFLEDHTGDLALKYSDPSYKEINIFDVDQKGYIYFYYQAHIMKVAPDGKVVKSVLTPKGFHSGYCVDDKANSYLFLQSKKIVVWSPELEPIDTIELAKVLGDTNPLAVKMAVDRRYHQLYLQTYEPQLREETLYRFDLQSHAPKIIFQSERAPYTVPAFGPGLFDWSLSHELLYISDAQDYRITTYTLSDGQPVNTFSRPFEVRPINPEDARLRSLGRDLPYILKPGAMNTYPAIWKISATDDGKLLVFTSLRDATNRQLIHIYDQKFRLLGTDLKYFRPGINNHLIANGRVYVADCSGEGKSAREEISPLDTPSLAYKLKIFKSRLN